MVVHSIRPIGSLEFAQMMQRVKPPVGWSETLAVANSGGPDSTCLLFLLNRYLVDRRTEGVVDEHPIRIVSLTIDHDLQSGSAAMANQSAKLAKKLGIQHITTRIPWGQGTYPPKPEIGEKIEERARDARYILLMDSMIFFKANSLALGHHLDDQVETMLMRLGRGSGRSGLAGMKPCRRWGMGNHTNGHLLDVYHAEKMRKWIVRPLLSVGKDRILATCDAHEIEYVTDVTNFQPQFTIRNAIRHVIANGGSAGATPEDFADFPSIIAGQLADINAAAAKKFDNSFNLSSDLYRLREASSQMTADLADLDASVDSIIAKYRLPSPPGTFMISLLSLKNIDSQAVREAFLYRVVRFVSPRPWGSPKSELGRRKDSVNRLVKHLWGFKHHLKMNSSLCVGSGVWWRLVAVVKGRLRTDVRNVDVKDLAWIALRQPEPRSEHREKQPNPLRLNVTSKMIQAREAWQNQGESANLEILFDGRFLVRFQVDKIPNDVVESLLIGGDVMIEPQQIWALPQITFARNGAPVAIHTRVERSASSTEVQPQTKRHQDIDSDWITMHYVRPLSAT